MLVRYGAHLSAEEVHVFVAPHPETVDLVDSWLTHHSIDPSCAQRSSGKNWIILAINVTQAERMLGKFMFYVFSTSWLIHSPGTTYNVYYHAKTSEYVVRTMSYSIPSVLLGHIDVIAPTTYFGTMRTMRVTSFMDPLVTDTQFDAQQDADATDPATCNVKITPSCLRTLYKTDSYTPSAMATNKLGVAGYLNEFANRADLQVCILFLCFQTFTNNIFLDFLDAIPS